MADNVTITAGSYTATVASDDIAGVQHQRVKLEWGPDGTVNDVDIATGKPMPIQIRGATGVPAAIAVTPNPDWTLGGVQVAVHGVIQANSSFGAIDYGLPLFGRRKDAAGPLATTDGFYAALQLDATGNLRVSGAGGGVQFAEDVPHTSGDIGTMALAVRKDAGGTTTNLDGDYSPLLTDANGALEVTLMTMPQVVGSVAHNAADTQPPVKIGVRARSSIGAPVSVTNNRADVYGDMFGRLVVRGSPPSTPVTVNLTASGNTQVIAAPGAGNTLVIRRASVHNRAATNIQVGVRSSTAGTIVWSAELASEGGGGLLDFGDGWRVGDNLALGGNLGAAGDVDVNVTEYSIEAV